MAHYVEVGAHCAASGGAIPGIPVASTRLIEGIKVHLLLAADNPIVSVWHALSGGLTSLITNGLVFLHNLFAPIFGLHAWGWAIIGLTIVIRLLLLPLGLKQARSMRAMQSLQPKVKAIQKKYKADKEQAKRDPAAYKQRKQKMNEEVMALYRENGVNPAAGCLPLALQAPVFFALFHVLRADQHLVDAPFYVFSQLSDRADLTLWGWGLIVLMAVSMFFTSRQMTASTMPADGPQAQQQKIMMYGMPVFLAIFAKTLPVGVLLYWVTTNLWQVGQQALILREVQSHSDDAIVAAPEGDGQVRKDAKKKVETKPEQRQKPKSKPVKAVPKNDKVARSATNPGTARKSDHLPRRAGGPKGKKSR